MSDEHFDPIAAMDQALRAMRDMARLVWSYYSALIDQGFAPDQALALALGFQVEQLRSEGSD